MTTARSVLVTGATGYVGRRLVAALVARGHRVRAFVRSASSGRMPAGVAEVLGDALDRSSLAAALSRGDTLVQLVGTPHPGPRKAAEFERVDLASVRAAVAAAKERGVAHFVYVSVAQPAPVMHAYVAVRRQGEELLAAAGLTRTILRPWYILGPGHRWPLLLVPLYALARRVPAWRPGAERLGLVTLAQMVAALVAAVEAPPADGSERRVEVPAIRSAPPV